MDFSFGASFLSTEGRLLAARPFSPRGSPGHKSCANLRILWAGSSICTRFLRRKALRSTQLGCWSLLVSAVLGSSPRSVSMVFFYFHSFMLPQIFLCEQAPDGNGERGTGWICAGQALLDIIRGQADAYFAGARVWRRRRSWSRAGCSCVSERICGGREY